MPLMEGPLMISTSSSGLTREFQAISKSCRCRISMLGSRTVIVLTCMISAVRRPTFLACPVETIFSSKRRYLKNKFLLCRLIIISKFISSLTSDIFSKVRISRAEPFRARSMGLCLVGRHPIHSEGGYPTVWARPLPLISRAHALQDSPLGCLMATYL